MNKNNRYPFQIQMRYKKKQVSILLLLFLCLSPLFTAPCGDVDSNGSIDIVDALLIAQFYVGLNPQPFDQSAADVSGDSLADIIDALQIARYYVGLLDSLAGCVTNTAPPTPQPVGTNFVYDWIESVPPEQAPPFVPGDVPAFPGAGGAGKWTVGGRGSTVYEVTSLADSGPGTLREAIEAEGPRTVIFRTGGVIHLEDRLTITNPYITIAGQTAPGGGIVISDRPFWINTYNVIVRHIRVRMGLGRRDLPGLITDDAFGGRPVSDIIVDHVSASWGHDENLSFYKMEDVDNDGNAPPTERVTVQWSIIGEALGERFHPYGTVFGGKHATYHHNLHACHISWEPYLEIEHALRPLSLNPAPDDLSLVNNVFFVWLNRGLEGGGEGTINIINNWFVPDMDPYVDGRDFPIIKKIGDETGGQRSRYMAGNIMQGRDQVSADNWINVEGDVDQARSDVQFEMFAPVTIESAGTAYEAVLTQSGATLPKRDMVDERIVDATRNQKSYYLPIEIKQIDHYPFNEPGIVDLPYYEAGIGPADDDHDGIPNAWELARGLDPNNPVDGPLIINGYSNLEWYLNALADGDPEATAIAYPQG